ncbi:MAG: aminotransferase class I/II-fold pyridoxal phosphate-dependent enzyme [Prosthecochloris sp.]|uniref:pyridoxal phosphate-dependent aminotransferase n=1 Tax=unclassified Prosthecochloris TaxID=2632826 RepID=UPI000DF82E7F|nr:MULTISPECIES: aminotransferase class I/II-fold pyridoxal phosphate-dependent enzyme [unclassified Prosthecochloris]MCW8799135.1 aminotransferase class I/II-fold pyridoxal phosphate-dependent enzyme [Prosthecochloris sp.]RDD29970.1 aminotransferase [Prosthecochloris sp. ZM]
MALGTSERCRSVLQSDIRMMSVECHRLGGINLSQGVCDTPVPGVVLEGASHALSQRQNSYTHYAGIGVLREALAEKYRTMYGIDVDPQQEIVVSAGATGAMYCAFQALLNPGDEVIVFEPYYGYHISTLNALQAVPVFLSLTSPDWTFSEADLEAAVSSRTRAILINTPGNPSGKVFTLAELQRIADFAEEHDLFVFTDEIYEHFLYDGRRHHSPFALPGMRKRTVLISGFSKTFSVTGWRIGYAISDARWAQAIGYFNDLVYVCAPSALQPGVAAGLATLDTSYYLSLSAEYGFKRNRFCRALGEAGLNAVLPQGAYYVLADVSHLPGSTTRDKAMHILRTTGVASVPGSAFFRNENDQHLVRFCYAKDDVVLDAACERLMKLKEMD